MLSDGFGLNRSKKVPQTSCGRFSKKVCREDPNHESLPHQLFSSVPIRCAENGEEEEYDIDGNIHSNVERLNRSMARDPCRSTGISCFPVEVVLSNLSARRST